MYATANDFGRFMRGSQSTSRNGTYIMVDSRYEHVPPGVPFRIRHGAALELAAKVEIGLHQTKMGMKRNRKREMVDQTRKQSQNQRERHALNADD